jgi:predicted ATP-binding protein involved in virulence
MENWLKDLELSELKKEKNSIPLSIVKKMLMAILDNNLTDIQINDGKVNFMERGSSVTINELSEGYKSVIIWVSDLLSRLIKLQPNTQNIKDFRGIVLVDEIDLHLHPKWGYSIVEKLRGWFPNIQFIFTTHSPTVILGSSEDAIFFKIYKEDGISKISQPVDNIKNLMANSVSTSPLFNLPDAWARNNDKNIDTSDDFLYSKIHKQIKDYNRDKKSITEKDIFKMIGETLRELTKDDGK